MSWNTGREKEEKQTTRLTSNASSRKDSAKDPPYLLLPVTITPGLDASPKAVPLFSETNGTIVRQSVGNL